MPEPTTTRPERIGTLRRIHLILRSNWISSLGAALMTLAAIGLVTCYIAHSSGVWGGPYVGILLVFILPAAFVAGLLMVPAGLFLYRKQLRDRVQRLADRPMYLARAVAVITLINLLALGTAGYSGAAYMSSTQFCGTACHAAMQPEYVTFQHSPHNRVDCVECHVGTGADWYVKSKINGTKQLIHYVRDSYAKPIPTPIENLRTARETCEECHDPEKYLGTKLLVRPRYREDEDVTPYVNVLLMRTGGTRPDGESVGIHWHVHPDARIEYVAADEHHEEIPWLRVVKPDGSEHVFAAEGQGHARPAGAELHTMDCNSCHNRTGHEFVRPEDAVDHALAHGQISSELRFIKKRALEALRTDWTREGAGEGIRRHLQQAYTGDGDFDETTRRRLEQAVGTLTDIWMRNIYPERGVQWNTYPALDSHYGCFRCHDGEHRDTRGRVITQECDACHVVLSEEEENPAILDALGLAGKDSMGPMPGTGQDGGEEKR